MQIWRSPNFSSVISLKNLQPDFASAQMLPALNTYVCFEFVSTFLDLSEDAEIQMYDLARTVVEEFA